MSEVSTDKKLKGKDLITIGIFSAIYFVINFAFILFYFFHCNVVYNNMSAFRTFFPRNICYSFQNTISFNFNIGICGNYFAATFFTFISKHKSISFSAGITIFYLCLR